MNYEAMSLDCSLRMHRSISQPTVASFLNTTDHYLLQMLNEQLEELAGLRGWRVTVVYDGAQNKNKVGQDEVHTGGAKVKAEGSTSGLDVVFSPLGVEADTVIEKLAFEEGKATKEAEAPRGKFIVCSDDGQIRIAAQSNGAMTVSAGLIVDELKVARKATMGVAAIASAKAAGPGGGYKKGWRMEDNIDLEGIKEELKRREDKRKKRLEKEAAKKEKGEG